MTAVAIVGLLVVGVLSFYLSGKQRAALEASQKQYAQLSGPVSYTHLRAHETVLELVCRLLLEKKKNAHREQPQQRQIRN